MTQQESRKLPGSGSQRGAATALAPQRHVEGVRSESQPTSLTETKRSLAKMGPHGVAILMSRVRCEHQRDASLSNPVTREELAHLLDHFQDRPLPTELRAVVQSQLVGARKKKRGPKSAKTSFMQLQEWLLLPTYDDGIKRGDKLREWLKQRQKRQRRNARPYDIPADRLLSRQEALAEVSGDGR